jgi:microsomal dipeptidase-like Zn-dependent dipeptidase
MSGTSAACAARVHTCGKQRLVRFVPPEQGPQRHAGRAWRTLRFRQERRGSSERTGRPNRCFATHHAGTQAGSQSHQGSRAQRTDAISYATKRIGVDHVGIASDFNHGGGVTGWEKEGEAQNVTVELLRRGYSECDIAKLWGGNFLRVLGEAQNLAKAY